MKIPFDVSDLKKKLNFNKATPPVKAGDKNPDATRRTKTEIHKQREKNRALTDELNNANTTAARKQEIIDGLQAQLETAQAENEEYKSKVEELTPLAKAHKDLIHKERTKLLEGFPPEKKAAAKKVMESMDIDTAREYATSVTGKGLGLQGGGDKGSGNKLDWEALSKDPAAFDKAVADNPKEFGEYMATITK